MASPANNGPFLYSILLQTELRGFFDCQAGIFCRRKLASRGKHTAECIAGQTEGCGRARLPDWFAGAGAARQLLCSFLPGDVLPDEGPHVGQSWLGRERPAAGRVGQAETAGGPEPGQQGEGGVVAPQPRAQAQHCLLCWHSQYRPSRQTQLFIIGTIFKWSSECGLYCQTAFHGLCRAVLASAAAWERWARQ